MNSSDKLTRLLVYVLIFSVIIFSVFMTVSNVNAEVKADLVKDINSEGYAFSGELTSINDTVFFVVNDGIQGHELLWKSDGTEAGTVMVKDIKPDNTDGDSFIYGLTSINETLFFVANDGIHGYELWKSDGTEVGTVMVKDIDTYDADQLSELINVNGTLFFVADDGIHGRELWKSDGTETGTVMVKDINPDGTSYTYNLTNVNGTLFFTADDGIHGRELWVNFT
jgi:ELWxxDGT repeat protein